MKKRKRWKPKVNYTLNRVPNFRYTGAGEGKFIFWRDVRPFNWGPVECDRDDAERLIVQLNALRGKDIEKIGGPMADNWLKARRGNNGS